MSSTPVPPDGDAAADGSTTDPVAEPVTIQGHWDFGYTYFAGASASRFFNELRLNQRIMGTHCPTCDRVLVPARGFCDACYVEIDEWREVGTEGTLDSFTILTTSFPGLPEPPTVVGYVTLDGASTALLNAVHGIDLHDFDEAGALLLTQPRVRVVFSDKCEGRITDFAFELVAADA
ncbi:Zn-ribbon domain-containing OB-fold protein [Acrocarpospora catenulata]|uniref:Zn-ribbon domain-containing OB-fold protein n=1 Tax=Acrocarpospora catenulata TaxID=2836182 RepID=UPI001BDA6C59|nr:OB-fold domain-containing protein [Acrocarpospora catenulata]